MKSNKLWFIILGSEMLANPSDLHGQEPVQADDSANLKIVPSSLGLAPKLAQASPFGACYARRSSTSRGRLTPETPPTTHRSTEFRSLELDRVETQSFPSGWSGVSVWYKSVVSNGHSEVHFMIQLLKLWYHEAEVFSLVQTV